MSEKLNTENKFSYENKHFNITTKVKKYLQKENPRY